MATINGTAGDDRLTGTADADTINAGAGDDIVYGGDGNDRIDAGSAPSPGSYDQLFGEGGDDYLLVYPASGTRPNPFSIADGGSGFDTVEIRYANFGSPLLYVHNSSLADLTCGRLAARLIGVERIVFYAGFESDDITGGDFNDLIDGGGGNDLVNGGGGNDVLFGGSGSGSDTVSGGSGDDLIYFDSGGNDSLDGGSGNDMIDFRSNWTSNVVGINLNLGQASYTIAGRTISLANFENVIGTGLADTIVGNGVNNVLTGGAGNDVLDGGGGFDTAVFSGSRAQYTFTNLGGGQVRVSGPDGTDTLSNIEQLQIGSQVVSVPVGVFDQFIFAATNQFGAGPGAGGWASFNDFPRVVRDINGDGRVDIVGFGINGTFVALGQANGGFGALAQVGNQFGQAPGAGGWNSNDRYPRMLADVNGDGRADIVGFGIDGTYVSLANGAGGFGSVNLMITEFGTSAGGWSSQNVYHRTLADVNGDGRADIIGFGESGTYVALGNTNGTFGAVIFATAEFGRGGNAGGWSSQDLYTRLAGDVNGDGRADIVGFGVNGTYVALGNANGTFGALTLAVAEFGTAAGGWSSQDKYPRALADLNGDGRMDIVGFGESGVYYAMNNGSGGFGALAFGYGQYGNGAGGWSSGDRYPRVLADVNGDKLADIIGFGESGVFVTLADGFQAVGGAAAFERGDLAYLGEEAAFYYAPVPAYDLWTGAHAIL